MRDRLGENLKKRLWDEHQANVEDVVEEEAQPQARPAASKYSQWVGGAVSLGLVLAMVYWVFELGQRDANEVPVIQAMGGVARDLPEDSQATVVANQGLQVNEVLANENTAPLVPETTLAPPAQQVLPEDTQPQETLETLETIESIPETTAPLEVATPTPQVNPATTLPPSLPGADPNMSRPVRRVQAAALSENAARLNDAIANAISELDAPAETQSPDAQTTEAQSTTPPPVDPVTTQNEAGENLKMVQFGTFDSEPLAIEEWESLVEDNLDLLGDLSRYIERREAGGRVFYKLRAQGIDGFEAAEKICETFLARGISCIALP